MAARLPAVLSNIDGHTSFKPAPGVLTPESVAGLASALRAMLGWSLEYRIEVGTANCAFATDGFSLAAWSHGITNVYGRLLSPRD
jgi:hypothetical protein